MENSFRSRFVPIQRQELTKLLKEEFETEKQEKYAKLTNLVHYTIHHEFHEKIEKCRDLYRSFDPDPITKSVLNEKGDLETFQKELEGIFADANFRAVTESELDSAFNSESLFPLAVNVNLDDYDTLILYRRGETKRTEKIRSWQTFYQWKEIEIESFDRLVVVIRLKKEALENNKDLTRVQEMKAGKIYLKFFKNIPKADVEMVLPNARLGMRPLDKLMLGGPLAAGAFSSVIKLFLAFGAAAAGGVSLTYEDPTMRVVGTLLLVMAGYFMKGLSGYKNTKLNYMQTLSQGLYFKNLANNASVVYQLLKLAEDEEIKEALLAYHFLYKSEKPLSMEELDNQVEQWFKDKFDRNFDFDVEDGLVKLKKLGLVKSSKDTLKALELEKAIALLDKRWDNYFSGN
jgi:hypothetical protein